MVISFNPQLRTSRMKSKVSLLAVLVCFVLALSAGPAFARGQNHQWGSGDGSNVRPVQNWDPCASRFSRYLSWCGGGDHEKPTNSVPEPGSALVFGAGLLVVGQHLRRKNRR